MSGNRTIDEAEAARAADERRYAPASDRPKLRAKTMEYDIGRDAHGRPVTLKMTCGSDGRETWEIHRAAGDQRDGSEAVTGLSADNLRALAGAVA